MKHFLSALTLLMLLGQVTGDCRADDTEDELQRFSDVLSKELSGSGRKKVAVLDFTDLQGRPLDIGRYVSEQLTVNLVAAKGGFRVVDRANLNSILAEHKLTTTGLVEPENAKKLGQVSGVDALVLGTTTILDDSIQLTAKVITTDTAEIVVATRGKLRRTSSLAGLLSKAGDTEKNPSNAAAPKVETPAHGSSPVETPKEVPNSQTIEELNVAIKSLKMNTFGASQDATIVLMLTNTGKEEVAVCFPKSAYASTTIGNNLGEVINTYSDGVTGIHDGASMRYNANYEPTVIGAGKSVRCIFKYGLASNHGFVKSRPFQLQLSLDVGQPAGGHYANVKTHEYLIDIK